MEKSARMTVNRRPIDNNTKQRAQNNQSQHRTDKHNNTQLQEQTTIPTNTKK